MHEYVYVDTTAILLSIQKQAASGEAPGYKADREARLKLREINHVYTI